MFFMSSVGHFMTAIIQNPLAGKSIEVKCRCSNCSNAAIVLCMHICTADSFNICFT